MDMNRLTPETIAAYALYLRSEEHAPGTIEKYLRDVRSFAAWLEERTVTKDLAAAWKEHLVSTNHAPATVNSMLAAINSLFRFQGRDFRVKFLKVQRRMFRDSTRELTRPEYDLLVDTARASGKERLALLMEAICGTGVRVSEVKYLTVEAAQRGRAEITLKGKIRVILLPNKLCRKLLKYARKEKIASGELFAPEKVFPHDLRHLFATTYYRAYKDIAKLADVLGHSSIETTRVYLLTTGAEQVKQLDRLGLVS